MKNTTNEGCSLYTDLYTSLKPIKKGKFELHGQVFAMVVREISSYQLNEKLCLPFPLPVMFMLPLTAQFVFLCFAQTTITSLNLNYQIRLHFFLPKGNRKLN